MRRFEQPYGFFKHILPPKRKDLVQMVSDLDNFNRAGPTVKKALVVAKNGRACGQHEQEKSQGHRRLAFEQRWQMDVLQSGESCPRSSEMNQNSVCSSNSNRSPKRWSPIEKNVNVIMVNSTPTKNQFRAKSSRRFTK